MRRWINLAGFLQYLLMLLLAGLLVLLVLWGASPGVFALALLLGALLAALPVLYTGAILLPRQRRDLQRVRQAGLPACAEVLADGAQLADDFSRHAGAFKSLPLVSEIPVRVLPATDNPPYPAQLSAALPHLAQLKPGDWLSARCDPDDITRVVPAQDPDELLSTWRVRPVQEADLPQLAEVIRSAFEEQRGLLDPPAGAFQETSASLLARLEHSRGWLAEVEGILVACIFYRPEEELAHLSRLAVLPEYRSLGIGRCLLAQAEQVAAQDGFNRVRLGVRAEIDRNREYYQRLGYQVVEEHSHEGYTKITVYIMEKVVR